MQKLARNLALHAIELSAAGNLAESIDEFDLAISLAPCDEEILISKAYTVYSGDEDCTRANVLYSRALVINPLNTDALALRGKSFEQLGLSHLALLDFNRAIEISPHDARLYRSRGWFHLLKHRYIESLRDYDKAISLKPENSFCLDERACVELCLGLYERGLKDSDDAITLKPNEAKFYFTRGNLLGGLGCFEDSIKNYDIAESLGCTEIYSARADAFMSAGRYREALADWQFEVNRYPKDSGFFLAKRGECFMKLQEWSSALIELNRAEGKHGDHPFVYRWRAEVFHHFGRYDEAIKDFSHALTFFDAPLQKNLSTPVEILLERARSFEKLKRSDLACVDLITVLKIAPFNREAHSVFLLLVLDSIANNSRLITFALEILLSFFIHRLIGKRRVRRLF